MKYELNFGCDVISLPKSALISKLPACKELELKALISLAASEELRSDYESGADALAVSLGCDRAALDAALAFWRGAGVLLTSKEANTIKNPRARRRSGVPTYTGEELAKLVEDEQLSAVLDELQKILKKTFNPTEANSVIALMRYLSVDAEYLMLLCNYCAGIGKSSMRYIETTAYNLYDEGVCSAEALDAHIKQRSDLNSFIGQIRALLGIGGRALSATENQAFERWSKEYGFTPEIIELAYNITVDKTGKYSIRYIDKVLANWNAAGLRDLEAIKDYNENGVGKPASASGKSFETDEFFDLALKRSYEGKLDK